MKLCVKCGNNSGFIKDKSQKDGLSKSCNICINKAARESRKRRILGLPSKKKSKYDSINTAKYSVNLKLRYGITLEDYNRMLAEQNECCAICSQHRSKFKNRLNVDHCHLTGKIRGLLCTDCNHGIGKLKDSTVLLAKAIEYLK